MSGFGIILILRNVESPEYAVFYGAWVSIERENRHNEIRKEEALWTRLRLVNL